MDTVSAIRCESYDEMLVDAAVGKAIAEIEGLDWVRPGMRVAVKVNLLSAHRPEEAVTPHPAVAAAVVKLLMERGAQVVIGDSPSGPMTLSRLEEIYTVTGMKKLEKLGATLNRDLRVTELPRRKPGEKKIQCCAYLLEADAIVDVCKLKTHGMMGMTAAVKNMYGSVPGVTKAEYHVRFSGDDRFAGMLVQLFERLSPRLALADAIEAMEGNGPSNGNPRRVGLIAASQNGFALDEFLAGVIHIDPTEVPTLIAARKRGLVSLPPQVAGDGAGVSVPDFRLVHERKGASLVGIVTGHAPKRRMKTVPVVDPEECVGCGVCSNVCPKGAIAMVDHLPMIDRKSCVRCFCCQELCPQGAMKAKRGIPAE